MSFLGLMTVRAHEAVVKHWTHMFDTRGRVILDREATIGRLQRENARLLSAAADCEAQKDEGATYVLKSLADVLGVTDWSIQNGSEEWEGDVDATMYSILVDAGVVDEEDNAVATHAKITDLAAELAALRPDAEKHRARVEKAKLNLKQNREKGDNRPAA